MSGGRMSFIVGWGVAIVAAIVASLPALVTGHRWLLVLPLGVYVFVMVGAHSGSKDHR